MFTVGSYATTPSLLFFHLSQHFSFRDKKNRRRKLSGMESPCISQLQTQEKRVPFGEFLEKYYFLQNGVQ